MTWRDSRYGHKATLGCTSGSNRPAASLKGYEKLLGGQVLIDLDAMAQWKAVSGQLV
jgi:hypothetical protein